MLLENHYCTFPVAAPLCHVCDHIISVGFICVDFVQPLRKNHLGDIFVSFCSPGLCIEVRWSLLYLWVPEKPLNGLGEKVIVDIPDDKQYKTSHASTRPERVSWRGELRAEASSFSVQSRMLWVWAWAQATCLILPGGPPLRKVPRACQRPLSLQHCCGSSTPRVWYSMILEHLARKTITLPSLQNAKLNKNPKLTSEAQRLWSYH